MPKNKQVTTRRKAIFGDPQNELPFDKLSNREEILKTNKTTDNQINRKKRLTDQ